MGHSRRAQELAMQLPTPETNRPGMMIYFDDWDNLLDELQPEQALDLLRAIVFYGKTGQEVSCNDKFTQFAFKMLKPKIDYDRNGYITSVWQGRYMTDTRNMDTINKPTFEEWLEREISRYKTRAQFRMPRRND